MEVTNPFGWIEIPVNDMARAIRFYNAVFGWDLQTNIMGELQMAWFPHNHGARAHREPWCTILKNTLLVQRPVY